MMFISTGMLSYGIIAIEYSMREAAYASAAMFASLVLLGFMHDVLRLLERIEASLSDKGE